MEYTSWRRFACSLQKSIHDITMTQTTQSEMIASMSFDKPTRQPATSLCMCSNRFSPPRQNVWTYTVVTDRITMISISPVVASYSFISLNSCLKSIVVIIELTSVMLSHGIAGDLKCYFLKVRIRLRITNMNFWNYIMPSMLLAIRTRINWFQTISFCWEKISWWELISDIVVESL